MSSMFEGPSQPSRFFAAPPQRRLFWPKVIGAFAAGVVVTVLISKVPSDTRPVPPPVTSSNLSRVEAAKQREQAAKAEQERKAAARSQMPNNNRPGELAGAPPAASPPTDAASPASPSDSTTAQAPAAPATDSNQKIAKQADALNCAQQAWPYVDEKCREAKGADPSTRPVRVIPTDRSAASSVVAAPPSDSGVPMPPPKPQIADEQNNTPPEPVRRNQAEAPTRAAPATVAVPPRRETSRETTGHAATDAVQDAPAATKSERRQRRDASRRERGNETAGETRRSREASRTRSRAVEDDDDVDMVVREHRLPDGRRVIIQRRGVEDAVDDEGSARRIIIQRRTATRDDDAEERAPAPGLRLPPFFINPFGER
jgi:hypothetical protein